MSSPSNSHNRRGHKEHNEDQTDQYTQLDGMGLSCRNIMSFLSLRDELSKVEYFAIRLLGWMNQPGWGRRLGMFWSHVPKRAVQLLSEHRWQLRGVEELSRIPTEAPLLLVSNHRTFFDLFIGMTALRTVTQNRLGNPCSFPVRSPFFYDHIDDILE